MAWLTTPLLKKLETTPGLGNPFHKILDPPLLHEVLQLLWANNKQELCHYDLITSARMKNRTWQSHHVDKPHFYPQILNMWFNWPILSNM